MPGHGRQPLSALRRHQRRLLFGGGGLVSLLILATLAVSLYSDVADFHAAHRQRFFEARGAVDYFLFQRDRAYTSNIMGAEVMWSEQQPRLLQQGRELTPRYLADGSRLLVRAEGRTAVPWLVLGAVDDPLPRPLLDAYLGSMLDYSAYTQATVLALRSVGPVTMYVYEPRGRLLAVSGVADEPQLLRALGVRDRREAFERLRLVERGAATLAPQPGPLHSALEGGRLSSRFDVNPINGQPSLVGLQTLLDDGQPFLRRVAYEPVETIKARLDERVSGAFAVITRDGRTVLRSAGMKQDVDPVLARRIAAAGGRDGRLHADGKFIAQGAVRGVDWIVMHRYDWADLWHEKGSRLLSQLLTAAVILLALWWLLIRLDRRVFRPALADASRVYVSEALSRVIIDTSPVGLVLMDPGSGEPLVENVLARQMAADAEAEGQALYAVLAGRARQAGDDAGNGPTLEFPWTAPGHRAAARQLQVSMAPAVYQDRAVWVCALRDITAQVELEQTLRHARQDAERARAAAESASQAKSAFVATMSHEIRTPLNGVLGHLELLARSPMAPAQRERVARIRLSADALLGIISDVLDFSKIEAGQLDIDPVVFDLRPVIEQAALLFSPEAQRKGVKLYYAIDPRLDGTLEADVHRIRQVLNNLLGNAVKFTESGRIVVRASLPKQPPEAAPVLRLQVVDSGIGLSAEQLAQLFQPFQQADASTSRRYGGSGLGLALCQQLARLLGGSIRAESTLGVGSVFTLEVPVGHVAAPADRPARLQGRAVTLLSAAAEWRAEIGALLQREGAEVTVIEQPPPPPGLSPPPGATLLLFGERRAWSADDETALAARHARIVRAYPSGPLAPQVTDDGVHVSTYAGEALLRALAGWGDAAVVLSPGEATSGAPTAPAGQRGTVLLVEDNPVNRELIQQQLEALGFDVELAEDGREGLERWQEIHAVAVLTDINMPVMNGYELARALRAEAADVPILAITATALASERERCRQAGITDLLLKPLDLRTLGAALDRYVGMAPVVALTDTDGVGDEALRPALPAPPRALPPALRRTFVDSTRNDMQRIEQARAQGDEIGLLDRAHALKGVLMMIGERVLGERFGVVEAQLRDGADVDASALDALLQALQAVVDQHAQALDDPADPRGPVA